METNTIPHEEIRQRKDRSWTFRLIDMIMESDVNDDLGDVCRTLGDLDDPRALQPLRELVQDTTQRYHLRNAAINVLTSSCISCTEGDRRWWWKSGDLLLQRLAVLEARTSESDILLPILQDTRHLLHKEAVSSLQFGFEEPDFQQFSIRALRHHSPDVQVAAATNLLWNEPVKAEDSLIANLWSENDDVASESADTLVWYSSKKVHLAFEELSKHGPIDRRADAQFCKGYFMQDARNALLGLDSRARDYLLHWLDPIDVGFKSEDVQETKFEQNRENKSCKGEPALLSTAQEIITLYDDFDGCWNEKAYGCFDWKAVSAPHRLALAEYFSGHSDHTVRDIACKPLSLWNRADILVEFLNDNCGGVRKSAAYYLRDVTLDSALALPLWNTLADVNCTSTRARETLESYVVHAPKAEAEIRLADIALNDKRISRVETAISELIALQSHNYMHELQLLLYERPLINWDIHTMLVSYFNDQRLSIPNFAELCLVDDLNLQVELAEGFSRGYHMQNRCEGLIPGALNGNCKNIRRRGQASSGVYAEA